VWHRHREPWCRVECDGCRVASAGGQMSNLSGKPTKHDLGELVSRTGDTQSFIWLLVNLAFLCIKSFLPTKFTAKEIIAATAPVTIASVV